jgi:hypothetical protein
MGWEEWRHSRLLLGIFMPPAQADPGLVQPQAVAAPRSSCRRSLLHSSMYPATAGPGLRPGGEPAGGGEQFNSSVELNASATALSSADPVRPIDWRTLAQPHAFWNRLPVHSPP